MTDTPAERAAESTWTSLRRRKVVQWGVVYVAAPWGFLQGLEYLSGTYDWPRPDPAAHDPRTADRPAGRPGFRQLPRRRRSATLTLLLLLGGGGFWYFQRASETSTATSSHTPSAAATDASIAVLPVVNMSPSKEQEYFADGISEELLNLLAQVPELRVIARTSSFSFKGKEVDVYIEVKRRK